MEEDDLEAESGGSELGVMSIGFLMPDPDGAVVWRGQCADSNTNSNTYGAIVWRGQCADGAAALQPASAFWSC